MELQLKCESSSEECVCSYLDGGKVHRLVQAWASPQSWAQDTVRQGAGDLRLQGRCSGRGGVCCQCEAGESRRSCIGALKLLRDRHSKHAAGTQDCWMSPPTAPRDCAVGARESKTQHNRPGREVSFQPQHPSNNTCWQTSPCTT